MNNDNVDLIFGIVLTIVLAPVWLWCMASMLGELRRIRRRRSRRR